MEPSLPIFTDFHVEAPLGRGGMAHVYLATQLGLERRVAIKVLQPQFTEEADIRSQFLREGRIIAGFNHSNIITVYASGEQHGQYFLAMEYLPGGTLRDRLKTPLAVADTLSIMRGIASALARVHRAGFVHRDIKPQNIVFRGDGAPVLTDFGIAKQTLARWQIEHTGAGINKGTIRYMSPEHLRGNTVLDGRSDLYSLGVVFYWMLVGKLPYDSDSITGLVSQITQAEIPPLPATLSRFQPVMDKLLARDREQRFSDAERLVGALEQLERPLPVVTSGNPYLHPEAPTPALRRVWRLSPRLLGATVLAGGLALGGTWLATGLDEKDRLGGQFQTLMTQQARSQGEQARELTAEKAGTAHLQRQLVDLQRQMADDQVRHERELNDLRQRQQALRVQQRGQQALLESMQAEGATALAAERETLRTLEGELAALRQRLAEAADHRTTALAELTARQRQTREHLTGLRAGAERDRQHFEVSFAEEQARLVALRTEAEALEASLERDRELHQQRLASIRRQRQARESRPSVKTATRPGQDTDASTADADPPTTALAQTPLAVAAATDPFPTGLSTAPDTAASDAPTGQPAACEALRRRADDLHRQARALAASEPEQALLLIHHGLLAWPTHTPLQALAAELRPALDGTRVKALLAQAKALRAGGQVQEAWQRYRQALALAPDDAGVRTQAIRLARWALAYHGDSLAHVLLADDIYREMLAMGEDYPSLADRLVRIRQLYETRHADQSEAGQRLGSLRELMAEADRSGSSACREVAGTP